MLIFINTHTRTYTCTHTRTHTRTNLHTHTHTLSSLQGEAWFEVSVTLLARRWLPIKIPKSQENEAACARVRTCGCCPCLWCPCRCCPCRCWPLLWCPCRCCPLWCDSGHHRCHTGEGEQQEPHRLGLRARPVSLRCLCVFVSWSRPSETLLLPAAISFVSAASNFCWLTLLALCLYVKNFESLVVEIISIKYTNKDLFVYFV